MGQAEVEQHGRLPRPEHEPPGVEPAMHETERVRLCERAENRVEDPERTLDRKRSTLPDDLLQQRTLR